MQGKGKPKIESCIYASACHVEVGKLGHGSIDLDICIDLYIDLDIDLDICIDLYIDLDICIDLGNDTFDDVA